MTFPDHVPPNAPPSAPPSWRGKLTDSGLSHLVAIAVGVAYGIATQIAARLDDTKHALGVMSAGYVFVLPGVVGFLTTMIASRRRPISLFAALLGSWSSVILCLVVALFAGWEGSICLLLAMPVYLTIGSMGALSAWLWRRLAAPPRMQMFAYSFAMMLPLGSAALESRFDSPVSLRVVPSSIDIAAAPEAVWPLVVRVAPITEPITGVFYRLGFPKPIEAILDREEVGGVRAARFAGNLVFVETVTDFDVAKRLGFSIKADPKSTPLTTLDPHVTVGGDYFDVLYGQYDLERLPNGHTRLHLLSRFRVSTQFNAYAGWWGEFLMSDIQSSILDVLKRRAELASNF